MWIYFLISIFWIETKYEDFIDGKISDGLYVSKGIYQEQDSGCIEFVKRFDINNDGYFDLTSADEAGPYIRIWLGSSSGYSPTNRIYLPRDRGGGVFIADLNLDTYPELIHSGHELSYATIFWGSPSGPSPGNYTTLYAGKCEAIYCDDINKDGWLDIILPGRDPTGIWIYYGSRNGYSNYLYIPFGEWIEHNVEIADLNKDGWKDMIFILSESGRGMIIYWGPNNTYRMEILPISLTSTHGLSVADLDKNGWLDLVISAYRYSIQSAILWGSSNGFDSIPPTIITTGYSSGGSAAWDFNKDNLLDIIFFRISYQKPKIYYNTGTYPYFNDTNSQEITPLTFWATGGFVGDFNFDGDIDIWLNNRADYSYVIWGPNWTNYTSLPVSSDLHGSFMEIGNTYNRVFYEEYISSIFYLGPDSVIYGGTVSWIADEPQGSKCEVYLRSGNSSQIDTSWTDWVYIQNSG
ncbi:MAG: VCBS repeat-containing protein, partial [candidate division WOR-3 bacterium]